MSIRKKSYRKKSIEQHMLNLILKSKEYRGLVPQYQDEMIMRENVWKNFLKKKNAYSLKY